MISKQKYEKFGKCLGERNLGKKWTRCNFYKNNNYKLQPKTYDLNYNQNLNKSCQISRIFRFQIQIQEF